MGENPVREGVCLKLRLISIFGHEEWSCHDASTIDKAVDAVCFGADLVRRLDDRLEIHHIHQHHFDMCLAYGSLDLLDCLLTLFGISRTQEHRGMSFGQMKNRPVPDTSVS